MYTIFSIYDGSSLVSTSVGKVNAIEGTQQYITDNLEVKEGQRAVFCVWTSLTQPDSVINKIYEF